MSITKYEESVERRDGILRLRSLGMNDRQIGEVVGLSGQRVFQIRTRTLDRRKLVSKYEQDYPEHFTLLLKTKGRDRNRLLARMRDGFTCQDCGKVNDPNSKDYTGRMLDIHHVNGLCGKKSRGYDSVSCLDDLVTLCHKCHFNRPEHTSKKKRTY